MGVGSFQRLLRRESVPAEEINMHRDEKHKHGRQRTCVQREEAGQRMMTEIIASDDRALEPFTDDRDASEQIGRHLGCPVTLLVPWKEIARERESQGEQEQSK